MQSMTYVCVGYARWIKIASAYPAAPKQRGINKTDWIAIDQATYDACLDWRDYRRRR